MIQANIQPYEYPLKQMQTQPLQSGSNNDLLFVTPIPLVVSGDDAKSDKLFNEFVTPSPKLRKNNKYSISKNKVNSSRKRLSDAKSMVKTKTKNVKKEHSIPKHYNVTSVKENIPRRSLPTSFDELESPMTKKKEKEHNPPYPSVFGKIKKKTKRVPQRIYLTMYENLGKQKKSFKVFSI